MRDVTDALWYAGGTGGGIVRTCPHEITFFDGGSNSFDEGELEGLLEKAKTSPEKYVELDGDAHSSFLFGQEWVWECKECQASLLKHEDFIWGNRRAISTFLNAKLKEQFKAATDEMKMEVKDEDH